MKTSVEHEEILAAIKVEDAKDQDKLKLHRSFVRIEIQPSNQAEMTRNPEDWTLKVDEEGTLPEWFLENRKKAEEACWLAWKESVQIQLVLKKEHKEAKDILIYAQNESSVEACDSSHVVACGSSHVVACGSSHVEACDSSHVEACDSSHVEACDSSHVEAYGSSHVEIKSSTAVVLSKGRVFVNKEASVTVTAEVKAEEA